MNTQTALKRCFDYFVDENHGPGYRDEACVYYANGSNPVMCAVGCLIPKKYQRQAGEVDGGINDLFREVPALETVFAGVDRKTLEEMQSSHDNWAHDTTSVWKTADQKTTRENFLDHLQSLMCFHEQE